MAQRPHVPQFGKWDNAQNSAYTAYFDQARKGRTGGKIMNPNDPEENPDLLLRTMAAHEVQAPAPQAPRRERPIPESDGEGRRYVGNSPARNDTGGMIRSKEPRGHQVPARGRGGSVGSEHSIERSPVHPRARAPVRAGGGGGVGSESPSWEEQKEGVGGNHHKTAGGQRSRAQLPAEHTGGLGTVVPRFGEWDEKDPSTGKGYTDIFIQVSAERGRGQSNTPGRDNSNNNNNVRSHSSPYAGRPAAHDSEKCCCFPWRR